MVNTRSIIPSFSVDWKFFSFNFILREGLLNMLHGAARGFKTHYTRPRRVTAYAGTRRTARGRLQAARRYSYRQNIYARAPTGERKFFDTDLDDAVVTTTMNIVNLTIIPEGNGESDRIGRKVTVRKISVRGNIELSASTSASTTSATVLCYLVQDKQTNGAQFLAADLLDVDSFKSFRNLSNSSRFTVLAKKVFNLTVGGAAPSGAALVFGEYIQDLTFNINCNVPIEYDNSATTGAIGTVKTNNLYWVTQSSTSSTTIVANARLRYTDN